MKPIMQRIGVYLLILVGYATLFGGWPTFPQARLEDRLVSAAVYFAIVWPVWMLVFEGVYQAYLYAVRQAEKRRAIEDAPTKDLPVPDTQRFDKN